MLLILTVLAASCSTKQPFQEKPHEVSDNEISDKLKTKTDKKINDSINKDSNNAVLFKMGDTLFGGKVKVEAIVTKAGKKQVTLRNISGDNLTFKLRFLYFNTYWDRETIADNSRGYKEFTVPLNQTAIAESVKMELIDANEIRIDIIPK